jgi:hypothetical protein
MEGERQLISNKPGGIIGTVTCILLLTQKLFVLFFPLQHTMLMSMKSALLLHPAPLGSSFVAALVKHVGRVGIVLVLVRVYVHLEHTTQVQVPAAHQHVLHALLVKLLQDKKDRVSVGLNALLENTTTQDPSSALCILNAHPESMCPVMEALITTSGVTVCPPAFWKTPFLVM